MLRFADSFDHYTSLLTKWTGVSGSPGINSSGGRWGTGSLRRTGTYTELYKTFSDSQAEWIVGFAWKRHGDFAAANNVLAAFRDNGTTQVDLRIDGSQRLYVTRAGTTLAAGTTILSASVFYYIEFRAVIHNSAGVIELRLNGQTEISQTGIDTQNSASASANQLLVCNFDFNPTCDYDDLYLVDAQGSTNNTFLNDVRVEARMPSGNGNSSQFDGSDGNSTDNYLLVDEASAPDGDTTYVESPDAGDKDTYAYADATPTSGSVYGVQILASGKKTDAGARSIKTVARLSATEVDSAGFPLSSDYQYVGDIRETKPGGGAWTISDFNSAEFGVKVV